MGAQFLDVDFEEDGSAAGGYAKEMSKEWHAAAREMLLQAASEAWGVPASELTTANSRVTHAASGRSETYAHFAPAAAALIPPASPRLKSPDEFTIMGKSKPRLDLPSKVDGSAEFGIDVRVDGMKYAAIASSPVFGGTVKRFDDTAARQMPGVVDVVEGGIARHHQVLGGELGAPQPVQ